MKKIFFLITAICLAIFVSSELILSYLNRPLSSYRSKITHPTYYLAAKNIPPQNHWYEYSPYSYGLHSSLRSKTFLSPTKTKSLYLHDDRRETATIGVFGGSVADYLTAALHHEALRYNAQNECLISFTNLAKPIMRYPDQGHVLLEKRHEIDYAITFDGINEILFEPGPPYSIHHPFSHRLYSSLDPVVISYRWIQSFQSYLLTKVFDHLYQLSLGDIFLKRSYYVAVDTFFHVLQNSNEFINNKLQSYIYEDTIKDGKRGLRAKLLPSYWYEGVHSFNQLAQFLEKPTLNFLQPLPQVVLKGHEKFKEFTHEKELRSWLSEELVKLAQRTTQKKAIIDTNHFLTGLENKDLFSDTCCHLNQSTNQLMAKYVFEQILTHLRPCGG